MERMEQRSGLSQRKPGALACGGVVVVVRGGTQRLVELRYEIWYDLVPVFLFYPSTQISAV
jgi:hypothetical protein